MSLCIQVPTDIRGHVDGQGGGGGGGEILDRYPEGGIPRGMDR